MYGKPLVWILECEVLNSVDQIDASEGEAMAKTENQLARVCQKSGELVMIYVSAQMDVPE